MGVVLGPHNITRMPTQVQKDIFLGRDRQLQDLLKMMSGFLTPGNALPHIALIWGQGGIGKSTLLREFLRLAEAEYAGPFRLRVLRIDWEEQRTLNGGVFNVRPEDLDAKQVLRALLDAAGRALGLTTTSKKGAFMRTCARIDQAWEALENARKRSQAPSGARTTRPEDLLEPAGELAGELAITLATGAPGTGVWKNAARFGMQALKSLLAQNKSRLPDIDETLLTAGPMHLARALGEDLCMAAVDRPVLMALDTYEIVDVLDPLIREVIKAAGPRVAWAIVGRRDLYETYELRSGERDVGYREEEDHSYHLRPIDLRALARQDIREYFRQAAPSRPVLDDEQLDAVNRATRAIPLAIRLAAAIWAGTGDIRDIRSEDGLTNEDLLSQMIARYEFHCVDEQDRHTLAAIAMAEGDAEILKAMLVPECEARQLAYATYIQRIRERYSAVQRQSSNSPRLHDEPARFYLEHLRGAWRKEEWVRTYARRASEHCRAVMRKPRDYHTQLHDLAADEDYIAASRKLINYLFWAQEDEACQLLTLRFLEGIAYSPELMDAVLKVGESWRALLENRSRKRLDVLREGVHFWKTNDRLRLNVLLEEDLKRHWLPAEEEADAYSGERTAIKLWVEAEGLRFSGRWSEALERIEKAISWCPPSLETPLRRKLCTEALAASHGQWGAKDYRASCAAADVATRADPTHSEAWRSLGVNHAHLKQYDKALEHCQEAVRLDPSNADNHRALGNIYSWLGQFATALEHQQQAVHLAPDDVTCRGYLGNTQLWIGHLKDAEASLLRASELDSENTSVLALRARLALWRGAYDQAAALCSQALSVYPNERLAFSTRACLHYVSHDFQTAREDFTAAVKLEPNHELACLALWATHCVLGDEAGVTEEFRDRTRQLVARSPMLLARSALHAIEGEHDLALDLLEQSVKVAPGSSAEAKVFPPFHFLRGHPRFIALTSRTFD